MDGGKFAQTVRKQHPYVAIVLVSGYADEEQWEHSGCAETLSLNVLLTPIRTLARRTSSMAFLNCPSRKHGTSQV